MNTRKLLIFTISAVCSTLLTFLFVWILYEYNNLFLFPLASLFGCMAINLWVLDFFTLIKKDKRIHLTITITNAVLLVSTLIYSVVNILTATEIFGDLAGMVHLFFVIPIHLIFLIINLIVFLVRRRKKK